MKFPSICLALFVASSFVIHSFGQSSLHGLHKGSWYPVVEIKGKVPYLFGGDGILKGDREKVSLLSAREFGEGFVDVDIISNVREGVQKTEGPLYFTAQKAWYHLKLEIVADRDIENCFYAMRFDTYGNCSFICRPLGDLKAGKRRVIELYTQVNYEMPEQLHIFSGESEIRTTLVPEAYSYEGSSFLLASND